MSESRSQKLPLQLEWRTPDELQDHPKNWKKHPPQQMASLESLVGEVGWAGALLLNEATGRLLNGHARKKISAEHLVEGKLPVLVGSWTQEQEEKILTFLDPIGALAQTNDEAFKALAESLQFTLGDPLTRVAEELLGDVSGFEDLDMEMDTSPQIDEMTYKVVITCDDEPHQLELLNRLESEGLTCQALIS